MDYAIEQAPNNEINIDQIIVLLQKATALVAHDKNSTRSYLSEAFLLLEKVECEAPSSGHVIRILAPWQARRIQKFIDDHLDCTIKIEALADQTRLSASYFFRAFRGTFGVTPHAYIMQCRTNRAMSLLLEGDEPLAQIAVACGFADQAHFSRVFSKRAGVSPGAWRRLQQGAVAVAI